jgi:hypothetical protein
VIAPVVAGLLGAVFCGFGILALSSGAQRLWRGAASEHWPSVEGTVLFSRVNASETQDSDDRRSTTFSPQFVYTYEVGGVKHFNNRRRFGRIEGSGEDWAADIATRYRAGKGVRVYYYQADPDVAVLETRQQLRRVVAAGRRVGGAAVRVGGADLDRARGRQVAGWGML